MPTLSPCAPERFGLDMTWSVIPSKSITDLTVQQVTGNQIIWMYIHEKASKWFESTNAQSKRVAWTPSCRSGEGSFKGKK
ncbi:hypothetical protein N7494_004757 [Penicillium frequentans]|uniref:Uncharacterized protein n=1 Tax=Penicillium frequentans TaxID=3151616 RepID=A0AAD6D1J3_9EURO|nr:hypothetical protein N7494_004757 [Penicillium glabrum]